ncbi:hypothetical protein HOP50_07g49580 [Chloropicon primus]|uniref:Uncharacterized protein n=1 Tax=Chloropicon primus TaxID=1764295 RepID=A0A5B8MP04_9CHLO|nr:hypothetical protein A3770_07p49360 [Chloropicon primus]UPR01636.1 hypothetical protein HOP50_07g49580 [Chloropicon primus]|eukprot:QDZ22418.1 hypothetical protein A3770_07p49360 [Chloropicon primus]
MRFQGFFIFTAIMAVAFAPSAEAFGFVFWQGIIADILAAFAPVAPYVPPVTNATAVVLGEAVGELTAPDAIEPVVDSVLEPVQDLVGETLPEVLSEENVEGFFDETVGEALSEENIQGSIGELVETFEPIIEEVEGLLPEDVAEDVETFFEEDLMEFVEENEIPQILSDTADTVQETVTDFVEEVILNPEVETFVEETLPGLVDDATNAVQDLDLEDTLVRGFDTVGSILDDLLGDRD